MRLTINKILIFLLISSFLGFIDATYLTIIHYNNVVPPCTITHGCERVLTSKFATIYGVPLSMLGVAYFFVSIILNVLTFQHLKNVFMRRIFMIFNFSGVIAAFVFLYLQFITLKAVCQYCLIVELILFLLFYFSVLLIKKSKLD
jgi:uncharacterized membrane protein